MRLNISKLNLLSFESDTSKAREDIAPKVVKFYGRLYCGGGGGGGAGEWEETCRPPNKRL